MDLLDAIEQHYELQHRQRQTESLSLVPTESADSKPSSEELEDMDGAVDCEETVI